MGHPFLSSFAFFCFVHSVAIIATIQPTSHVTPSLGLTLLPICHVCCDSIETVIPSRGSYRFGNYLRQIVVLATLFHVASFHSLLGLVSFDAVSVPPPGFPSVTICQPTYRDCTLHVPRRLWKVRESNPPAHPRLFRESPKGVRQLFPLFQVAGLHLYSGFSFLVWWLTHRHRD